MGPRPPHGWTERESVSLGSSKVPDRPNGWSIERELRSAERYDFGGPGQRPGPGLWR